MLYSLANSPSALHAPPQPRAGAGNLTDEDLPFEGLTGVAGAIIVFEQVIKVSLCPSALTRLGMHGRQFFVWCTIIACHQAGRFKHAHLRGHRMLGLYCRASFH